MANLGKIVYLSEEQKEELFENDTITVDGVTIEYSENDIYVTPQAKVTPIASPAFTGIPTAPTATAGTSTNQLATTAFVQEAVGNASSGMVKRSIVQTLPQSDIDSNTIYMIPKITAELDNAYNEFMYINNNWELIGSTEVDLSNYLQNSDIAAWAKAANKPSYTAAEVGALPANTVIPSDVSDLTDNNSLLFSGDYTDLTNIPEDKIFPVVVSLTSITNGSSDKSHTEIAAAVTAGKIPFVYITFGSIKMIAPLARVESNYAVFVYQDQTVTDHMNYANLKISENNVTITWRDRYATLGDIPGDVSAFRNDAGYLVEHQDISGKAPIASPNFTGTPTAPTPSSGNDSTQLATTEFVNDAIQTGDAYRAASIPFGQVDSTSTSTIFTATVDGITELRDGVCVYLRNGVVTSASGFTININNLGAKPVYQSLAAATASTTIFNISYTMLFIYNSTRIEGGCWDCFYGYNSNTDTIGYQLRTNSTTMPVSGATYRYRLLFTSADGTKYVPANTSTSTNATATRTVNQTPINPWGAIRYYSQTTAISSGSTPGVGYLWSSYNITLGYSFNRTGAALTLTPRAPVYIKAAPQADSSAIIDSSTPYVQALPDTEDGKIYIFLGIATGATTVELVPEHPVYYYKDGTIKIWTNNDINETMFLVNVTLTSSTTGTSDKSAYEIYQAVQNSQIPYVKLQYSRFTLMGSLVQVSIEEDEANDETYYKAVFIYDNQSNYSLRYVILSIIDNSVTLTPTTEKWAVESAIPIVDTTITQNSTNAISSGAVYAAIGDIETALEALL